MRQIPRTSTALIVVLTATLALAGCSAGAGGSSASDGSAVDTGAVSRDGDAPAKAESDDDQALVITGSITITADDPLAAAERATSVVADAGGRIDARQEFAPSDGDAGSATLTLRVPASAVDEVREELGDLGRVEETALESVNVGAERRDLDSRIRTLRATIARYTAWLGTAAKTSDLIELESAISERQTELESLEAQQRSLADRVAMSTIT